MGDLKIYYWEKKEYHGGASLAIADSLEDAKELIIKKFKKDYLEDDFNKSRHEVKEFIKNGCVNEDEWFKEETWGRYNVLLEELQEEPKIFEVTKKQGFPIWASL